MSTGDVSHQVWDTAAALCEVLETLNDASEVLGGDYPTASLLPVILARLVHESLKENAIDGEFVKGFKAVVLGEVNMVRN